MKWTTLRLMQPTPKEKEGKKIRRSKHTKKGKRLMSCGLVSKISRFEVHECFVSHYTGCPIVKGQIDGRPL